MISHGNGGKVVETPHLEIPYSPCPNPCRRPSGERPSGASLDPWSMPEPGVTPAATNIPVTRDGTMHG